MDDSTLKSGQETLTPNGRPSKARTIMVTLAIIFAGPLIGLLLALFRVALAPPWTSLTSLIYVPTACLGLPVALVMVSIGRMRMRRFIAVLILTGIVTIFYLVILTPFNLPTGITECQEIDAQRPQVRFSCVSTSSDDLSYRYEFTLEGREGWPVMQIEPAGR